MQAEEAFSRFPYLLLRLVLKPHETLKLPAENKGNTLRGAFGSSFRRLVCVPQCRSAQACPLAENCPYKLIFEPSPPEGSDRLSKNQDIPRPFVFRPPSDSKTTYESGEVFEFELVLLGTAVNYLPYFVLAFREVVNGGFGLNRARCELTQVRARQVSGGRSQVTGANEQEKANGEMQSPMQTVDDHVSALPALFPHTCRLSPETLVYSSADQVFHQPEVLRLGDYVNARLAALSCASSLPPNLVTVSFLTPTYLRAGGQLIREPAFHHLFKRLRDRLNALSTFYGPGPIEADFKALGDLAESIQRVRCDVHWVERYRTSSKTHQRHELSGFVGSCIYNFAGIDYALPAGGGLQADRQSNPGLRSQGGPSDLQSGIINQNTFSTLLPWLVAGEVCQVGKHAAWGNGLLFLNCPTKRD